MPMLLAGRAARRAARPAGVLALVAAAAGIAGRAPVAGSAPAGSLAGIYDLRLLNRVLAARGEPTVDAAGLGHE